MWTRLFFFLVYRWLVAMETILTSNVITPLPVSLVPQNMQFISSSSPHLSLRRPSSIPVLRAVLRAIFKVELRDSSTALCVALYNSRFKSSITHSMPPSKPSSKPSSKARSKPYYMPSSKPFSKTSSKESLVTTAVYIGSGLLSQSKKGIVSGSALMRF
jgi:hypothetical protein